MIDAVKDEAKEKMGKSINSMKSELKKIRTGRASLSLLDDIKVEYYGTMTPLNQLATLSVPESRLITIQPWEKSIISDIERAIAKSDLGLNPSNDGQIIRVPIPALSGERREELVRLVRSEAEDHKIALRNSRRDARDIVEELEKESEITEDQMHRLFDNIDELIERYSSRIEKITEEKEEEIREV